MMLVSSSALVCAGSAHGVEVISYNIWHGFWDTFVWWQVAGWSVNKIFSLSFCSGCVQTSASWQLCQAPQVWSLMESYESTAMRQQTVCFLAASFHTATYLRLSSASMDTRMLSSSLLPYQVWQHLDLLGVLSFWKYINCCAFLFYRSLEKLF